jgi:YD repeat-containing protein
MNKKYQRYIKYIVSDIEAPYFENMREMYGLSPDEYKMVLSKVFNQDVKVDIIVANMYVYDRQRNTLYYENDSTGNWIKYEYDANGNLIYSEDSNGSWYKKEYDINGNLIYSEDSNGYWVKYEHDSNGNLIYSENSNGSIIDIR